MQIHIHAKQYLRKSLIVKGRSFGREIRTSVSSSSFPELCIENLHEDLYKQTKTDNFLCFRFRLNLKIIFIN